MSDNAEQASEISGGPLDPPRSAWTRRTAVTVGVSTTAVVLGVLSLILTSNIDSGQGTAIGGLAVLGGAAIAFVNGHLGRNHEASIERDRRTDNAVVRRQTDTYERARLAELISARTQSAGEEQARLDELVATREQAHRRETTRDLRTRFTTAAAQLANPGAPVRLAGVFSLGSLADDWAAFAGGPIPSVERQVCVDLLCAYLRNDTTNEHTLRSQLGEADVVARIDVLRDEEQRVRDAIISLIRAHTTYLPEFQGDPTWTEVNFDLSAAKIAHASLPAVKLTRALLVNADLYRADLRGAQLSHCDISQAILDEAQMKAAQLVGANFTDASLHEAHVDSADFSGAIMHRAKLEYSTCTSTVFKAARLTGAQFVGANLVGADFRGARLTGANFYKCVLHDVDFAGADVRGTSFSGSRTNSSTSFSEVDFDEHTTWPDGSQVPPRGVTARRPATFESEPND
ncbi:pentapeptide repeat-containing protein [Rhodococcoides fascians]|uniref:pentapeptide repeat-containing protein n=1 Tax=Rhodococcoides fascians TaxID=1828 RepID=UPI0018AFB2C0|nr:pentapeptide repeat-containing protein [Rhodococcus fascians]